MIGQRRRRSKLEVAHALGLKPTWRAYPKIQRCEDGGKSEHRKERKAQWCAQVNTSRYRPPEKRYTAIRDMRAEPKTAKVSKRSGKGVLVVQVVRGGRRSGHVPRKLQQTADVSWLSSRRLDLQFYASPLLVLLFLFCLSLSRALCLSAFAVSPAAGRLRSWWWTPNPKLRTIVTPLCERCTASRGRLDSESWGLLFCMRPSTLPWTVT